MFNWLHLTEQFLLYPLNFDKETLNEVTVRGQIFAPIKLHESVFFFPHHHTKLPGPGIARVSNVSFQ